MCSGRFCSFLFYFSFFNRDCCHLGFDATYDCQIYRVTGGNNRTVFDNRYNLLLIIDKREEGYTIFST